MSSKVATLEAAEIAGWADLFRAAPSSLVSEHGIALVERDGVVCTAIASTAVSPRLFNHAMGLGVTRPATEADVDAVERVFADLGCPFYLWSGPDLPSSLRDRLEERGYTEDYAWVKFRRGASDAGAAETDLSVARIGRADADAFGAVVATSFGFAPWLGDWLAELPGRPGWHCWLAKADGEAAAAGALFVLGDSAWVALGSTLPEYRGRGAQSTLFAERLRAARELGCSLVVTETGEVEEGRPSGSYRNILRAGFERAYVRANLAAPIGSG
jgi:GNAT superfamily N-acetyltransferase